MIVEPFVHEGLQAPLLRRHRRRKPGKLTPRRAHFGDRANTLHLGRGMRQHIIHHQPDLVPDHLAQQAFARSMGKAPFDRAPLVRQKIEGQKIVKLEKPGAQAIVDVVVVIGDVVRHRRYLRLQRGPGAQHQREGRVEFGERPVRGIDGAVMLGQSFKQIPGEVEAIMTGIGTLNPHDRAQRLRIMTKAPMTLHRF